MTRGEISDDIISLLLSHAMNAHARNYNFPQDVRRMKSKSYRISGIEYTIYYTRQSGYGKTFHS